MKKRVLGFAAATAFAVAAIGAPVAAEPNENACFGQGRSTFASENGGPGTSNGFHISQRKGENPAINAQWILDNC